MANKIQLRRDTAVAWSLSNPILSQGEAGYDLTNKVLKIGDGVTRWDALPVIPSNQEGTQGLQGLQGLQGTQGIQGPAGETTGGGYPPGWPVGQQEGYLYNDGDGDLYWRGPIFPLNSSIQGYLYNNGNGTLSWQAGTSGSALPPSIGEPSYLYDDGTGTLSWVTLAGGNTGDFVFVDNTISIQDKTWTFDTTGNITLPEGGDILDSLGNSVLGGSVTPTGNTFYVSKNGSDSNDGLTQGTAFLTIKYALTQALSGETIYVAAGLYEEVFPLTVPTGVSIIGAGIRATTIKPTANTDTNDCFELFGQSNITDLTIRNHYYKASTDSGYAFRIKQSAFFTSRSPYIERVTLLYTGRNTSESDPYGYESTGDGNQAGRGFFIDGGVVASGGVEPALLLNEVTMLIPNSVGIYIKNGARAEILNSFIYFADKGIVAVSNSEGRFGAGKTKVRLDQYVGSPILSGYSIEVRVSNVLEATLPIVNVRDDLNNLIYFDGKVTVNGIDLETLNSPNLSLTVIDSESNQVGTATGFSFVDYKEFGAEIRTLGCANLYGNKGIDASGLGVEIYLTSHNFFYIGGGKDANNDKSLIAEENQIIVSGGAKVYKSMVDQNGKFSIGSHDKKFSFNPNGTLTLPLGGIIQEREFFSLDENWRTMELVPDFTLGEHLKVVIFAEDDTDIHFSGKHVHITTGDLSDTGVLLGLNNQHVLVESDGSVKLKSKVDSNITFTTEETDSTTTIEHIWTMTSSGDLLLPNRGKISNIDNNSGDGLGYSTLNLIPDTNLNTDQYLIVDPTAPNHIHLRAGGTQDSSTAALFLGGELNYARVTDGYGVRLNNAQFIPDSVYFEQGVDYDSATWSTDESGNHWIDIRITDPFNPTRSSDPINTAGSRFSQYPTRNSIEVFTGSSLFTVSGNGQAYSLGNPYDYRIGTVEAPPENPTTLASLDYRLNTFNERYLYLENNALETYADTVSVFSNQTIDLVTGTGNLRITTDDNNSSRTWYFTTQGYLQFPQGVSPATSKGKEGDEAGSVVFDGSYIYFCHSDYTDGLTDIWKRVAWSNDTWTAQS